MLALDTPEKVTAWQEHAAAYAAWQLAGHPSTGELAEARRRTAAALVAVYGAVEGEGEGAGERVEAAW